MNRDQIHGSVDSCPNLLIIIVMAHLTRKKKLPPGDKGSLSGGVYFSEKEVAEDQEMARRILAGEFEGTGTTMEEMKSKMLKKAARLIGRRA
jgi:hypothetical protein